MIPIHRDPTIVGGKPRIYTTDFKTVAASSRMDAEYFDPKYSDLFRRLRRAGEVVRLGDYLSEPPKRGVQPDYVEHGEVIVLNSQHVHEDKLDTDTCSKTSEAFVKSVSGKGKIKQYDVLLNSTGYVTIGRSQCVLDDLNAIVDSHVTILRPKLPLDPVYLGVFLNCGLGYLQTEQAWTGSSGQIELSRDSIAEFKVLLLPREIQATIRESIQQAHTMRREARRLIEDAHRRIEQKGWG